MFVKINGIKNNYNESLKEETDLEKHNLAKLSI